MRRAKILFFINYKGGIAKTVSTYYIGCSLAQHF
jgi:cellulose biosynthesis protein BcsQ